MNFFLFAIELRDSEVMSPPSTLLNEHIRNIEDRTQEFGVEIVRKDPL